MMLLRTAFWFLYFWIYLICTIPILLWYKHLARKGDPSVPGRVEYQVMRWATCLMRVAGLRVTVNGKEHIPEGPKVFIANHQGNFDIPVMLTAPGHVHALLAKDDLERIPILNDWMRLFHCTFVERSSPRAGMESITRCVKQLAGGSSMIIFPEGTRSRSDAIGEFKGGAFRIASHAKVPVVPVTIDGTYRAMEQNPTGWLITPTEVRVTFHPPIETGGLSREALRELPERTRSIIASGLKGD